MVKMDEYVSENEFLTFELHDRICIDNYKLLVANGAPAGAFFFCEKHAPGFVEHALSGFGQVSSIFGTQGVPRGPSVSHL